MILEEIKEILENNRPKKEESYWKDILGINIKKEGHASAQYCCFLFMNRWFEKGVIRSSKTKSDIFCYKYAPHKINEKGDYLITKIEQGVFVGLKPEDLDDIKVLLDDMGITE